MWPVLHALSDWAQEWTDLTTEHADPDAVLWSWAQSYLRTDLLPERRVVVRFDFHNRGRRSVWLLIERGGAEICRFDPGFGDDVTVRIDDPITLARSHLGSTTWADALRSGAITVAGPRDLRRALRPGTLRPKPTPPANSATRSPRLVRAVDRTRPDS
jgi:hypothetical protein